MVKNNQNTTLLTGNEAVAYGALKAGVGFAGCFPGGPTTEVVYTLARLANENEDKPHVEFAVNEKVALESASGAAMSGVPAISVMKHFGINNAADQLFSINLMGIPGLVVVVGDDPNGHSSHSEQDTRAYPIAAEIPCIEPSTPQEAYEMIQEAYKLSYKAKLPVYFRLVKWLCHGAAPVELDTEKTVIKEPYWDDTHFQTRPIVEKHIELHKRLEAVTEMFENWSFNRVEGPLGEALFGIIAAGYAYVIVKEAIDALGLTDHVTVFKLTTINPFPRKSLAKFLAGHNKVLIIEEGEAILEEKLKLIAYEENIFVELVGRKGNYIAEAGELKGDKVRSSIAKLAGLSWSAPQLPDDLAELAKSLPQRKPSPRPGNPHRSTIYAVYEFIRRSPRKVVFMGDVGESATMARPLMKSHAAMGAGIGMAIGASSIDPSATALTIVGDGTIFGFALNGLVSAVHNNNRVITLVADNGTMESTGWQPTPTSGMNLTGEAPKVDIAATLRAIGLKSVEVVNSRDTQSVLEALEKVAEIDGPTAVVAIGRYDEVEPAYNRIEIVPENASKLRNFVNEFACPALGWNGEEAYIDEAICTFCGDCSTARPDDIKAILKEVQ
ncbi:thiamine pyrophosphate-dependent enzyme [Tepidibacillus sp. HK-1]|uniref:thiamine pyrophosphate-dependent enzyme n=1 Tax=Tepidibacillus sp. HK-1 TaxID=1883407 RepID=UPI000852F127|nr:thiamine pyrophosphate-dependent enzyme [Tepidibacillus sp. HK-1]GBF12243.1 2-oxoacid ferredoxin oxidoreductase [Tepidibacillus sp. HK-1]